MALNPAENSFLTGQAVINYTTAQAMASDSHLINKNSIMDTLNARPQAQSNNKETLAVRVVCNK